MVSGKAPVSICPSDPSIPPGLAEFIDRALDDKDRLRVPLAAAFNQANAQLNQDVQGLNATRAAGEQQEQAVREATEQQVQAAFQAAQQQTQAAWAAAQQQSNAALEAAEQQGNALRAAAQQLAQAQ